MPKVQYGVSTTLDGLFTGIPSLVKQVGRGLILPTFQILPLF